MLKTHNPILSVIIPTHGRPCFLKRAIDSVLSSSPAEQIEIIVVPNGKDQSWKNTLNDYQNHNSIKVYPIENAHGNIARNHGLEKSRGKYIRFLDDDDYLYKDSWQQVELLEATGADICSGLTESVSHNGVSLGVLDFPKSRDFPSVACRSGCFTLPVGNVFLRAAIGDVRWNPKVNRAQDNIWMMDLASNKEWIWVHLPKVVGVWFQHPGPRTSEHNPSKHQMSDLIEAQFELRNSLLNQNRLTNDRSDAIVGAILNYSHYYFIFSPIYWSRVIRKAICLAPHIRPNHEIFKNKLLRNIHPLIVEWSLFPVRRYRMKKRITREPHDYHRKI